MNEANLFSKRLPTWMHLVLRFAGGYNILAGLTMMVLYHEGFKMAGIPKADFNLPIQLVGMFVILCGFGYLMVDRRPYLNQNVLLIGLLSKTLGPLLGCYYIFKGDMPYWMLVVFFFADTIYLYPFFKTYKHIENELKPYVENA